MREATLITRPNPAAFIAPIAARVVWKAAPRLSAWIGDADAVYRYSGSDFDPFPWIPALFGLRQRLQDELGDRHQRAGVAGRDRGLRMAVLDLLDRHAHGRILFAAQRNLHRVVHGHHLAGGHHGGALVHEPLQGLGQAHQQQVHVGMPLQQAPAGRQGDGGTVVAAHAVNGKGDHACKQKGPRLLMA